MTAHPCGKSAVECRGASSSLDVSQYRLAGFEACFVLDFLGYVLSRFLPMQGRNALGYDYNRIGFAFFQPFDDYVTYVMNVERKFGKQDNITSPAIPECRAIQPALCPITSMTITRWWELAVE